MYDLWRVIIDPIYGAHGPGSVTVITKKAINYLPKALSERPIMQVFCAPQPPLGRKVRAAAIERGLEKRLYLEYAEVAPGRPNAAYAQSGNQSGKIPALITDAESRSSEKFNPH